MVGRGVLVGTGGTVGRGVGVAVGVAVGRGVGVGVGGKQLPFNVIGNLRDPWRGLIEIVPRSEQRDPGATGVSVPLPLFFISQSVLKEKYRLNDPVDGAEGLTWKK